MERYLGLMRNYKISMIVPVFNAKAYLKRCVGSLTGQNYDDLEVILVDDGSTDGSGDLCDELGNTDPRIKVVHKENGGLVSAWKAGVETGTGEYFCFVDSVRDGSLFDRKRPGDHIQ